MISDWSGAAIEYAFATKKPVIFIDTMPKINNKNWDQINLPCLEENIRKEIGEIININHLNDLAKIIHNLFYKRDFWSERIVKIRNNRVFNINESGKIGAEIKVPQNKLNLHEYLFGEDQSRYLLEVGNKNKDEVSEILKKNSIHYEIIGKTKKDSLDIDKKFKIDISELNRLNSYWFRSYFK